MNSPDLKARVLAEARKQKSPSRKEWRWTHARSMTIAFVITLACFWLLGGIRAGGINARRHLERPSVLILETALGAAFLAGIALWVAFGRGRSMLGRPRTWLLLVVFLTPAMLLTWKLLASASVPEMMVVWPERLGLRCMSLSMLFCIPPLVAASWLRRGTDPVHPVASGAALGVAMGAAAWVLVDLWCPVAYLPHLLLGHVLPLFLLALVGAIVGRWVLAPRARKDS